MRLPSALTVLFLAGTTTVPALSRDLPFCWGVQGSLGLSTGDLKDTTSNWPCLSLGGHMDFPMGSKQALRARMDGLFFRSTHEHFKGTGAGDGWDRDLKTKVQGWSLGAEYLLRPLVREPRLTIGAGLHAVRWSVDATSTLDMTVGSNTGRVVETSKPSWTKLGVSLLVAYQIAPHLSAEARVLSSAYGWEGEHVQVGQLGLAWTF